MAKGRTLSLIHYNKVSCSIIGKIVIFSNQSNIFLMANGRTLSLIHYNKVSFSIIGNMVIFSNQSNIF